MRMIRERLKYGGTLAIYFDLTPGYKKVFGIYLWRRAWTFEFGKGDGYDWD